MQRKPLFITGAGFSLAANRHCASSDNQLVKPYPLISDLGRECFGSSWIPGVSVEAAFESALRRNQQEPIDKLAKVIQAADFFVGSAEAAADESTYKALCQQFPGSHYLTFNYDSLMEQVLLKNRLWNPTDGFGVPVKVNSTSSPPCERSTSLVIHLHGSVLLYSVDYSLEPTMIAGRHFELLRPTEPEFIFDPDNLTPRFHPFRLPPPGVGYQYPAERVIVPVPDKSRRHSPYITAAYARAKGLLAEATHVIAIGYAFAECDQTSFAPLIYTLRGKPFYIIAPDAQLTAGRLRRAFPGLRIHPEALTLAEWAETGFAL